MEETSTTSAGCTESTATLDRATTATSAASPDPDTSGVDAIDEGRSWCLKLLYPGVFYMILSVLVVALVIFEYKTSGVRRMFNSEDITPEVVAPAVLRATTPLPCAETVVFWVSTTDSMDAAVQLYEVQVEGTLGGGAAIDATVTSGGDGNYLASTSPAPAAATEGDSAEATTVAAGKVATSAARRGGLMRRFFRPLVGPDEPAPKTSAPRWRPPASCLNVSLATCEYESYHERAFYVVESSVGGFFCAEWVQHTHCPINEHRFSIYSHCDAKCRGESAQKCDAPKFRLCTTEDKLYQFYYSEGSCRALDSDEMGCLVGRNRFETKEACNEACGDVDIMQSRCREEWGVGACAFDHLRYLYYYNAENQACEMFNFCARSAFRTAQQCERACLRRRPAAAAASHAEPDVDDEVTATHAPTESQRRRVKHRKAH